MLDEIKMVENPALTLEGLLYVFRSSREQINTKRGAKEAVTQKVLCDVLNFIDRDPAHRAEHRVHIASGGKPTHELLQRVRILFAYDALIAARRARGQEITQHYAFT